MTTDKIEDCLPVIDNSVKCNDDAKTERQLVASRTGEPVENDGVVTLTTVETEPPVKRRRVQHNYRRLSSSGYVDDYDGRDRFSGEQNSANKCKSPKAKTPTSNPDSPAARQCTPRTARSHSETGVTVNKGKNAQSNASPTCLKLKISNIKPGEFLAVDATGSKRRSLDSLSSNRTVLPSISKAGGTQDKNEVGETRPKSSSKVVSEPICDVNGSFRKEREHVNPSGDCNYSNTVMKREDESDESFNASPKKCIEKVAGTDSKQSEHHALTSAKEAHNTINKAEEKKTGRDPEKLAANDSQRSTDGKKHSHRHEHRHHNAGSSHHRHHHHRHHRHDKSSSSSSSQHSSQNDESQPAPGQTVPPIKIRVEHLKSADQQRPCPTYTVDSAACGKVQDSTSVEATQPSKEVSLTTGVVSIQKTVVNGDRLATSTEIPSVTVNKQTTVVTDKIPELAPSAVSASRKPPAPSVKRQLSFGESLNAGCPDGIIKTEEIITIIPPPKKTNLTTGPAVDGQAKQGEQNSSESTGRPSIGCKNVQVTREEKFSDLVKRPKLDDNSKKKKVPTATLR